MLDDGQRQTHVMILPTELQGSIDCPAQGNLYRTFPPS